MAATEYQIILYDKSGVKKALITDYYELYYINRRNEVNECQFVLNYTHPALAYIEDKGHVEIKRRNRDMDLDWYTDYTGLIRSIAYSREDDAATKVTVRAFSPLHMLEWRVDGYYADTLGKNTAASVYAERLMKDLVRYNFTASATPPYGRIRSGSMTGYSITIAAGCTSGCLIDSWSGAHEIVLGNLQQIAEDGGVDFDLIKTDVTTFDFRCYAGQRGTDRSASILFSMDRSNMANPSYTMDRYSEKTVGLIGGRGEESDRNIIAMEGTTYVGNKNDIEFFYNATQTSGSLYPLFQGYKELQDRRAKGVLTFTVLQTPSCFYGKHYTWGDKVRAVFENVTACMIVDAVTVRVHQDGGDGIEVDLEQV